MEIDLDAVTYAPESVPDAAALVSLPDDQARMLRQLNGFVAWDGALHVFGAGDVPPWHDALRAGRDLRASYPTLTDSDTPFAQDCVGDVFFLRDGAVWKLWAETGEVDRRHTSLAAFFDAVCSSPDTLLETEPLQQFKDDGGTLEPGQLLAVWPPYCTAESESGVALRAISALDRRKFLADFSSRTRGFTASSRAG